MEITNTCTVCFDTIISSAMVICMCGICVCRKCCIIYILESFQKAHCTQCKVAWDCKFLYANFEKSWIEGTKEGQYRNHIKKIALDREKSHLQETIADIPRMREERAKHKERMQTIISMEDEIKKLYNQQREIQNQIREIKTNIYAVRFGNVESAATYTPNFLCPCPYENCKGMIDSIHFQCCICEKRVCRQCREPREKGDEHICNEDVVKNLKLVRADTKPCPKCAVPIFRIAGCDGMFCTICKISFDWRTGKIIIDGPIHNPHAIRWMQENGGLERNVNDIPCGGLIRLYTLKNKIKIPLDAIVENIYRCIAEIEYKTNVNTIDNNFNGLRLQYVLNEITEGRWQQAIFLKERTNERKNANLQILTTFRTLAVERFRNLSEKYDDYAIIPNKVIRVFVKEMDNIRIFINKAFIDELIPLGNRKPYQINSNWIWV
jgi:hypothetical protein